MADFCKKCSIKTFGDDYGDLANLVPDAKPPYITDVVICEGCGPIQVNHLGECVSPDCEECKREV